MNDQAAKPKTTTYFVNGEEETTTEDSLTVRQILEDAGFSPAENYTLKSENPPHNYENQPNAVVTIHNHERFDAFHNGPTPTS